MTICADGWHDWPTQPATPTGIAITIEDDVLSFEDTPTADYEPLDTERDDDDPTLVDVAARPEAGGAG